MKWLTRQEQIVLFTVVFLVLLGLTVKTYRTAAAQPRSNSSATVNR